MTRKDLPPAVQACQSTHAAIDFVFEHPSRASPWHSDSNYLVLLSVENEAELEKLITDCKSRYLDHTVFREPDLGNVITAVAIEPSSETQKLVSRIPLLFNFKNEQNESV